MLDTEQEGANKPLDFLNILCGYRRMLKRVRKVWDMCCDMAAKDAVKRETASLKHLSLEVICHELSAMNPRTKP